MFSLGIDSDDDQKKLPQHDFNNPEVYQTLASFRLIKQHIENIQEKAWSSFVQNTSLGVVVACGP